MYRKDSRPELENKIERYKALARQVPDDETAQNIRSLVAELEQKLRQTGEQGRRVFAENCQHPIFARPNPAISSGCGVWAKRRVLLLRQPAR